MSEIKKYTIEFLKALADPTRLEILYFLEKEALSSSEIQNLLKRSQSTVSKHLNILIDINLIDFQKNNNVKYYNIRNKEVFDLLKNINIIAVNFNKEKFKNIQDADVYDILT
ncbi:MAG: ArsR/SmtB family transcription factor [Promethearchaeota archaeon]|jgi:DNA-binding transcriptional ArsR family regulator